MPKLPLASSARSASTPSSSTTTASGVVMRSFMRRLPAVASRRRGLLLARLVQVADHVERAFRPVVGLAVEDGAAAGERVGAADAAARRAGEGLGHHERLAEEALQPAGPLDDQPVARAEFLDPEQRDDVLQVLEAGERLAGALGEAVMLLADDQRIEQHGRRGERIDGRIEPLGRQRRATA